MVQLMADVEGEVEFLDENSLETKLFQYMFMFNEPGFAFKAESKVSELYLLDKLICRVNENNRTLYFFPGIGAVSNKTLPKEEIRNKLLSYKRDFVKQGYELVN